MVLLSTFPSVFAFSNRDIQFTEMQISKFEIARFKGQKFTSLKDKASLELPASAFQGTSLVSKAVPIFY